MTLIILHNQSDKVGYQVDLSTGGVPYENELFFNINLVLRIINQKTSMFNFRRDDS